MRELATKAEELLLEQQGLALATALVLCPSRDSAIPFYDVASNYVVGEGVSQSVRIFLFWVPPVLLPVPLRLYYCCCSPFEAIFLRDAPDKEISLTAACRCVSLGHKVGE